MAISTFDYIETKLSKNSSNMFCDLCMMVVNTLDNVLKKIDSSLDDAEDELNDICSMLGDLADEVGKGICYHCQSQKPANINDYYDYILDSSISP